ncbi:hypothetical protein DYU11_25250 [Fibrisoma montanum]|uniref:Uncharacterized protein n=1 Tax=Fibrisoma montanum TaxID=2305895 RepID=A0A418M1B5_9BACT|nr:hypothetical protein [Fibrisoma montanum]RIV19411.1 hypothetical protein DYU11_25250 [Fibrisoma montanum]
MVTDQKYASTNSGATAVEQEDNAAQETSQQAPIVSPKLSPQQEVTKIVYEYFSAHDGAAKGVEVLNDLFHDWLMYQPTYGEISHDYLRDMHWRTTRLVNMLVQLGQVWERDDQKYLHD